MSRTAAAAAAATTAGLIAAACELKTEEEIEKQAVGREAHASKRQCALAASSMSLLEDNGACACASGQQSMTLCLVPVLDSACMTLCLCPWLILRAWPCACASA